MLKTLDTSKISYRELSVADKQLLDSFLSSLKGKVNSSKLASFKLSSNESSKRFAAFYGKKIVACASCSVDMEYGTSSFHSLIVSPALSGYGMENLLSDAFVRFIRSKYDCVLRTGYETYESFMGKQRAEERRKAPKKTLHSKRVSGEDVPKPIKKGVVKKQPVAVNGKNKVPVASMLKKNEEKQETHSSVVRKPVVKKQPSNSVSMSSPKLKSSKRSVSHVSNVPDVSNIEAPYSKKIGRSKDKKVLTNDSSLLKDESGKKNSKIKFTPTVVVIGVVSLLLIGAAVFGVYSLLGGFPMPSGTGNPAIVLEDGQPAVVTVSDDDTVDSLRGKLKAAGLSTQAKDVVSVLSRLLEDGKLPVKSGVYTFHGGDDAAYIADRLMNGGYQAMDLIEIDSGMSAEAIKNIVVSNTGGKITSEALNAVLEGTSAYNGFSMFNNISPDDRKRLFASYAASGTYSFEQDSSPEDLVREMFGKMQQAYITYGISPQEFKSLLARASAIAEIAEFDSDKTTLSKILTVSQIEAGEPVSVSEYDLYAASNPGNTDMTGYEIADDGHLIFK